MDSSLSFLQSSVPQVKKELFSGQDNVYGFVSPSAYETAWLAVVPDPEKSSQPMFRSCLTWVLNNQREGGFWGELDGEGLPAIDTLPATLACMVALMTWNAGEEHIRKGLDFVYSKAEIILKMNYHHLPRWFTIAFPAIIELARRAGLDVFFPQGSTGLLHDIFCKRQQILETENLVDDWKYCSPLLSHLESLPAYYVVEEDMVKHLSIDGSIFQSPSATASAYMATGNPQCLEYLKDVVERCPNGVPPTYPMDEDLINLCMVDQLQRLGLAEHFGEEIEQILKQVYRNQRNIDDFQPSERHNLPAKLFKDALAFRLLRMQGYDVTPCRFCWFLSREDVMDYMEQNCEHLTTSVYGIYRATDLRFSGEQELEDARSFSRKLLEKSMALNSKADELVIFPGLHKVIKHELSLPWITRMDHLDHRLWIEENKTSPLWTGKTSFYSFRQSIYAKELEELTRWSKTTGLADIGFGREKTAYCYFAISASSCLPHDSIVRLLIAKTAIIVTVADDFYDMEGSLCELKLLTEAILRWDGENLSGRGKTIFNALDDFVTQTAANYQHHHGSKFSTELKDLWKETFASWMAERRWSLSGCLPSMHEYLNTGMISIGAHLIVLPAASFLTQSSPNQELKPAEYPKITKLFMTTARLLNDTQSYQKEQQDGKMNFVLLHLKENPKASLDDSIAFVKRILDEKTKEFVALALMDVDLNDQTPKSTRQLHLSCMKVFHMFFNSTNLFDTKTELLDDIKKAIYVPLRSQPSDLRIKLPPSLTPKTKEITKISARFDQTHFHESYIARESFLDALR